MMTIGQALQKRLEAVRENKLEEHLQLESKEYNKKWAEAVQFFQKEVNKEMKKEGKPEYPFMAIRYKLEHVKDISDLRWFYGQCLKYQRKKGKEFTFGRCFFGALKQK